MDMSTKYTSSASSGYHSALDITSYLHRSQWKLMVVVWDHLRSSLSMCTTVLYIHGLLSSLEYVKPFHTVCEFPWSLLISFLCAPTVSPLQVVAVLNNLNWLLLTNTLETSWIHRTDSESGQIETTPNNGARPWACQTGQIILMPPETEVQILFQLSPAHLCSMPDCWSSVTMVTRLLDFKATVELRWSSGGAS